MTATPLSDKLNPIDAVIAWVDGNDPHLSEKREQYLNNQGSPGISSGAHSTRFASNNEIKYCVLSILRFAPFVRNIFIVTDGQKPDIFKEIKALFPDRIDSVKIVDHTEIFEGFENFLPTFNSISIGNMIWRIRELSDNFVYFNDDTFLIRKIDPEDWFINNTPIIRGKWLAAPLLRILWNRIKIGVNRYLLGNTDYQPRASFHLGQWASASLLGFRFRYFSNSHTPHTVEKSLVRDFFNKNRDMLEKNILFRFRNHTQFTFISLSNHLQLKEGKRNIAKPSLAYLQPHKRPKDYIENKIRLCESNHDIKFMCVQSLDLCTEEEQNKVLGWLDSLLR